MDVFKYYMFILFWYLRLVNLGNWEVVGKSFYFLIVLGEFFVCRRVYCGRIFFYFLGME